MSDDELTGDVERRMREWRDQQRLDESPDAGTIGTGTDDERIMWAAHHFDNFMHELGYCGHRDPHLAETPIRVARMYWDLFHPEEVDLTSFAAPSNDMVVVRDVPFASFCAHHWLPFIGTVSVGYIPNEWILGLSKIPRLIRLDAGAPQVQEQLTADIRTRIAEATESEDVAVVVKARHMCMELRGVRSPGETLTSSMTGAFRDNPQTRAEFFAIAGIER